MPAPAKDTFLKSVRAIYGMAAPPSGVSAMPTLWLDEAPEGEGFPRAVLEHGGEAPDPQSFDEHNGGNASWNEAYATIHLFAVNNSDTAEDLATSVRSVFTPESINLTFDQDARIFRVRYLVKKDPTRSTADKPVYVASLTYKGVFGTSD